jgi:hypothetical protein
MNELIHLTPNHLRRAANIKERIDELQGKMNDIFGAVAQDGNGPVPARRKRRMSRAGRAAIAAAARARWAKYRGTGASAKPGRKAKRKFSAAAKAKMAAAARARWKAAKAAGKTTL